MHAPGFVLGYHGCDKELGGKILRNQTHVSVSKNRHDWLGHGAYFWENSPKRALQWADYVKQHPQHFKHKIKEPFVVGAIIRTGAAGVDHPLNGARAATNSCGGFLFCETQGR